MELNLNFVAVFHPKQHFSDSGNEKLKLLTQNQTMLKLSGLLSLLIVVMEDNRETQTPNDWSRCSFFENKDKTNKLNKTWRVEGKDSRKVKKCGQFVL